jgi:hypothetical protein
MYPAGTIDSRNSYRARYSNRTEPILAMISAGVAEKTRISFEVNCGTVLDLVLYDASRVVPMQKKGLSQTEQKPSNWAIFSGLVFSRDPAVPHDGAPPQRCPCCPYRGAEKVWLVAITPSDSVARPRDHHTVVGVRLKGGLAEYAHELRRRHRRLHRRCR